MSITATELKENLSKYLILSMTQDVYITKNGKIISKLTNPFQSKIETAKSLFGSIPADMKLDETKEDRINKL